MRGIWLISNSWRAYTQMLSRRPMCCHALTSGTIFLVGDLIAQRIERPKCVLEGTPTTIIVAQAENRDPTLNSNVKNNSSGTFTFSSGHAPCWDLSRAFRLFLFGATMSGPVAFAWFRFMDKLFPQRNLYSTMNKILTHTFAYAPAHLSTFCAWMGFSEGLFTQPKFAEKVPSIYERQQVALHRAKQNAPRLWLAGCVFWIPVVLMNYAFIPLDKRVLVNNCCNLIWTCFLSLQANRKLRITPGVGRFNRLP